MNKLWLSVMTAILMTIGIMGSSIEAKANMPTDVKLTTDPSRVLMIGDSLTSDIQGGNNFGIDTCWFNPTKKQNPTTIEPSYEIHSWNQLVEIVMHQ